jgi:Fe2+ transport system protein FeoA
MVGKDAGAYYMNMKGERAGPVVSLAAMRPGEGGIVVSLDGDVDLRVRLMEMGVVEGTPVKVIKYAPLGDPMEILLRGYHLSLRKDEARRIMVRPADP